jgi:sugar phosphate isomerase/epimerase
MALHGPPSITFNYKFGSIGEYSIMKASNTRREFLKTAGIAVAASAAFDFPIGHLLAAEKKPVFKISLGEWSLHRALFGGQLRHVDVAKIIKQDFDIDALEYSAQFFKDKVTDKKYVKELRQCAVDQGVIGTLITVDNEGILGDPDARQRTLAVNNHRKWIDAARTLGCESIRVNPYSDDKLPADEQAKLLVDGLTQLVDVGAKSKINVIVENHGHMSSNGKWLANVVKQVDRPTCGTLPDFGNFHLADGKEYDRYQGVTELMPYAKGVSAKSYDFDDQGNETKIDYRKMLKIVVDAGFHGYLGIEYEGPRLSEPDGIKATKKLLETIRGELATS